MTFSDKKRENRPIYVPIYDKILRSLVLKLAWISPRVKIFSNSLTFPEFRIKCWNSLTFPWFFSKISNSQTFQGSPNAVRNNSKEQYASKLTQKRNTVSNLKLYHNTGANKHEGKNDRKKRPNLMNYILICQILFCIKIAVNILEWLKGK